jgi:hypothetical protein
MKLHEAIHEKIANSILQFDYFFLSGLSQGQGYPQGTAVMPS